MNVIVNFVLFQTAWFACVLGAAKQQPWLGVAVSVGVMLYFVYASKQGIQALKLLAYALLIGLIFDALPVYLNWVRFQHMPFWSALLAPAWMLALWVNLATTLNSSLAWLQGRPWLASLFGAVGGPLAYFAGQQLGAMHITQATYMLMYLAIGWGMIMPFLLHISAKKTHFERTQYTETGVA